MYNAMYNNIVQDFVDGLTYPSLIGHHHQLLVRYYYTVFMLIERMIQLLQENSIPGIVCIPLERKRRSVIIFYESN